MWADLKNHRLVRLQNLFIAATEVVSNNFAVSLAYEQFLQK